MLGGRAGNALATGAARARTEEPPSFRVPGASIAAVAKAATTGDNTNWASKVRGATTGGGAAPAQRIAGIERTTTDGDGPCGDVDDDGFQRVIRKGRRGPPPTASGAGAPGDGRPTDKGATNGDDRDPATDDADAVDGDDGDEQPPTAADLQQAWRDEIALIKKLRGQGVQDGHPAMRAAHEARDAAERAWRSAKEPAPPAVRLGRAQSKLDRAVVLQSEARQAILDEEREHRERMATLQATMDACTERVTERRRQVREIQAEVGSAAGGDGGLAQRAQMEAIKAVHGTICEEVGPTLAALAEQVGTETPAWATLNSLLAKLADSKAMLEGATSQPAARYHIGDGDDRWETWTDWSESHDVQGQRWGKGDARQEQEQWDGQAPHNSTEDESMGTDQWWYSPTRRWGSAARWHSNGYGQWSKASWADQLEDEMDDDDDADGQPPTARRRLGGQAGEEAQQLQTPPAQQQCPTAPQAAATEGAGGDVQERHRKHQERVNHIVSLAVESGVTPLTASGEDLLLLGPEQLEEWVAACLPSALLC